MLYCGTNLLSGEAPYYSVRLDGLMCSSHLCPFILNLFKSICCRYAGAFDEKDRKRPSIKHSGYFV